MAAGVTDQVAGIFTPAEAPGGIYLELTGQRRGQGNHTLPVGVTGLSAGGVVLGVEDTGGKFDFLNLKNRKVVICLPERAEEDLARIHGRVIWSQPEENKPGKYLLGLALADPDLRVRKVLEDRLQEYPRDIKELWDQWDRVHARRITLQADQAVYLVGAGAMMGGTALYFLGPASLKLYGSILAIYGCLMMAARSVWALWQERAVPED